jgi:hypothetical protein
MKSDEQGGMDARRFRALLEAYGADFARWPERERAPGQALLASSSEAARWWADERGLDEALDTALDVAPSPALLRRVAEIPVRLPRRQMLGPVGHFRHWLVGAAALAAVGAVVGVITPEPAPSSDLSSIDDFSPFDWSGDLTEELEP